MENLALKFLEEEVQYIALAILGILYVIKILWLGRIFPKWVGAEKLTREWAEKMYDSLYGSCTVCRRCSFNCPMGIDYGVLIRAGRSMLSAVGRVPDALQATGAKIVLTSCHNG